MSRLNGVDEMPEEVMPWIQAFGAAETILNKIHTLLAHKKE